MLMTQEISLPKAHSELFAFTGKKRKTKVLSHKVSESQEICVWSLCSRKLFASYSTEDPRKVTPMDKRVSLGEMRFHFFLIQSQNVWCLQHWGPLMHTWEDRVFLGCYKDQKRWGEIGEIDWTTDSGVSLLMCEYLAGSITMLPFSIEKSMLHQ